MKIIKELSEYIDDELGDAKKYVKKALHLKEKMPQLAQIFFQLSMEEMEHMNRLHTEAERLIAKKQEEGTEIPLGMAEAYEILHERAVNWAKEIKVMQAMFRE